MKKYLFLKIISIILISFFTVKIFSNKVFIANSPKIRPNLTKEIASAVSNVIYKNTRLIASIFNSKLKKSEILTPKIASIEKFKNVPFKQMSKGIYAKTYENVTYTIIKEGEVEWLSYDFRLNNKIINIRIPKGSSYPSENELRKMLVE